MMPFLPMRAVVLGSTGLLGSDMVVALREGGWQVQTPSRGELDLRDERQITAYFLHVQGEWIVNCAGYTRVDDAEENEDEAYALNAMAPFQLARHARRMGARLLHVSTDYVFDGKKSSPYQEGDEPNPLSVYGKSKLLGEQLVLEEDPLSLVVRSSWLFGEHGRCFPKTILRLAQEKGEITVVSDQKGSPTYTWDLARALVRMMESNVPGGVYHVVNSGEATWYELAEFCLREAGISARVIPISSEQWPARARRPRYSVLDTTKFRTMGFEALPPWQDAVRRFLKVS